MWRRVQSVKIHTSGFALVLEDPWVTFTSPIRRILGDVANAGFGLRFIVTEQDRPRFGF
jgi:hypothetical protein